MKCALGSVFRLEESWDLSGLAIASYPLEQIRYAYQEFT
jgi:hypothetical protein